MRRDKGPRIFHAIYASGSARGEEERDSSAKERTQMEKKGEMDA